jgi:polysaccharide pyruvyl transferase WcaK-like protein
MKILIDNGEPQFSNLGDVALLVSAYLGLRTEWPEAEIFTFATRPERLREILPEAIPISPHGRTRWSAVAALGWFGQSYSPLLRGSARFFRSLISRPPISRLFDVAPARSRSHDVDFTRLTRFLNDIDLYVWAGGGFLADHFGSLATQLANTLEYLSNRGVPSVAFGLGVGPLNRPRIATTVQVSMSNLLFIGLRERFSHLLLQQWSFPENKLCVTGDDAIPLVLPKRPAQLGSNLGIGLRVTYYSGLYENELQCISRVLNAFCSKHGVRVASIPIARQDLASNRSIFATGVPVIEPEFTLESLFDSVASCRVVVTASYHAAVFALSMGVSVVAIVATDYYRQKFEGLKGQFDDLFQIVQVDASTGQATEPSLAASLEYAWEHAPERGPALTAQAEAQMATGLAFRRQVFTYLRQHFAQPGLTRNGDRPVQPLSDSAVR